MFQQEENILLTRSKQLREHHAESPKTLESHKGLESDLYKKTRFGKAKRFFVLKGSNLTYYKSRNHYLEALANYQKSFDLKECEIEVIEKTNPLRIKIKHKNNRAKKPLTILYSQRAAFEEWLSSINLCQQDSILEDLKSSSLHSLKRTEQYDTEVRERRYALPMEAKKHEPSSPDPISLTVNKENIIYLGQKPFLSIIFETNTENTFFTPKSTHSKFEEKLLLSSGNLTKAAELYCSPGLRNSLFVPTYRPKKSGGNLNNEDNQANIDGRPTYDEYSNNAIRFYERVFKAIQQFINFQSGRHDLPNHDIKFDELLLKLKKDMEDIFDNCHVFQNIERHIDANESLTYALDCFQKLMDESYAAKMNLRDFKKILIVIEKTADYYQTLLENKSRQLISIAKGSDQQNLPDFFYKECVLYFNEISELQSMYKAHLQRLFGVLGQTPPILLEDKEAAVELIYFLFDSELDKSTNNINDLKTRENLIEKRLHKRFLSLRVLNALLMFLKDHLPKNSFESGRSIRIYGV